MTKTDVSRSPVWKRAIALFLRVFMCLGALFICFEIGVWIHPPLMAWGLSAVDRNLSCSSTEALQGAQKHEQVVYGGQVLVDHSRLVQTEGGFNLWHTPRGDWWVPKGSDKPVLGFLAQQEHKIYGEGTWGIQKSAIVLDCGANVGVYTREALDEGASLVIAIEPAPVNVECLRRNFKREIEEKRVIVVPVGVWDKEDVLPLYEDPDNSGGDSFVIRGPNDRIVNVPLVSIDKLVKDLSLPRVDFIKMDIKGATAKALIGAKQVLTSSRPRLALSTEEREDNPAEIRSLVMSLQPSYHAACGICSVGASYKVNPDVLLFRP
jgi:FkbM family methyltransferase